MTVLVVDSGRGTVQQRQLVRSGAEDASGCLAITVRQGLLGGPLQESVQHSVVVMRQLVQVSVINVLTVTLQLCWLRVQPTVICWLVCILVAKLHITVRSHVLRTVLTLAVVAAAAAARCRPL
jgi:hypothetical protein